MNTPSSPTTDPQSRSKRNFRNTILVIALIEFVILAGTAVLTLARK